MMRRFLILSLVLWYCIAPMVSKTYLVSVGVADYPGTKNDLKNCDNDAVTMKNLYERNGDVDAVLLVNDGAKLSEVTRLMNAQF